MGKNNKSSKFAIGAAVAAAAGFVAGILTAPKSGKDTRDDIQQIAGKARTEAEHRLKALHSELSGLIDQGKSGATGAKDDVKKQLSTILSGAQKAKDKAREMLSAVHEGDAEDKDLDKAIDDVNAAIGHLKKFLSGDAKTPKAK